MAVQQDDAASADGRRTAPAPARPGRAPRLRQEPGGPTLVEGPVEVVCEDGSVVRSDRPMVAVCTCHRSRILPWCDTSHRARRRDPAAGRPADAPTTGRAAGDAEPDAPDRAAPGRAHRDGSRPRAGGGASPA
ncbi:CDGSH iron-sulfur domain-containing protein [Streptomyces sp. NPDC059740]|uniref:CDGSH iron-sulfur domain-containing protein n=1 Tax=Streptomyces sp. NPDC059740 TaxID=3346926 RepID=UPI00364F898D